MKTKELGLWVMLVFSIAAAHAAIWTGWDAGDTWSQASNWSPVGVPDSGEKVQILYPSAQPCILDSDAGVTIGELVIGDGNGPVTMIVKNGGNLTVGGWGAAGYNRSGDLSIEGGTITFTSYFAVGMFDDVAGSMGLTIQDGNMTVSSTFFHGLYFDGIPTVQVRSQLDGGVLEVGGMDLKTGVMDITAGTLIVNGNVSTLIETYKTNGQMTAYDGTGKLVYDYGQTHAGKTTIKAIKLPGNMDDDVDVDMDDLVLFCQEWLVLDCDSTANFDEFCRVDYRDFEKLASNWLLCANLFSYDPAPYSGQTLFPVRLRWKADCNFASYDVYLGTDYNAVLNADHDSPEYKDTVSQKEYALGVLESEQVYHWRIDGISGQSQYTGPVWNFSTVNSAGWKVVNTAAGEWIAFEQVFLTAGHYRFTGRVSSNSAGQSVRLELDGASLGSVSVPDTGGIFQRIHLGHTQLAEGSYQLKFIFETGSVDLDWFFIRKNADTSGSYRVDDTVLVRADESGYPILGTITGYEFSNGLSSYPDDQYELPMYNFYDRDTPEFWDMLVDELLLSRIHVVMMHGRGCFDPVSGDSGNGNMCPRLLRHLVDAIDRTEGARNTVKLGMWDDTGAYYGTRSIIEGLPWGTKFDLALDDDGDGVGDLWKYLWDYNMKIWFDTVPKDLWYRLDGRPVIAFWGPIEMIHIQGNASRMFAWLRTQFINRYGEDPHFNVTYDWTTKDTTLTTNEVQAAEGWFIPEWYPGTDASYSYRYWNNDWWGCAVPAFRNPNTLPGCGDPCREIPRLSGDVLRDALDDGASFNAKFTLLEGWTDMAESAGFYRSNDWDYPNQYIGIVREYSDFQTESLRLEAEACDFYSDTTSGNSGGQYRDGDLDILKL